MNRRLSRHLKVEEATYVSHKIYVGKRGAFLPHAASLTPQAERMPRGAPVRFARGAWLRLETRPSAYQRGIATVAQLGFHPLYLALAIGCGSKPLWWMNDSAFWIVTKMSGMSEEKGLLTLTPILSIMGTAGLIIVIALAALFPLV